MNSENINNSKSEEIGVKDLVLNIRSWFKYLRLKWVLITGFAIFSACLGFLYAYYSKAVYTATTTFVLEDEKGGGIGNLAGLASIAGVDIGASGGSIFQGDNILALYKSRKMVVKALLTQVNISGRQELLVERYITYNDLRKKWLKSPELINLKFSETDVEQTRPSRLKDSILAEIVLDLTKNYLKVGKVDEKLSIISVEVKAKDEEFAKAFNETIVKKVNDFYLQTKTKKALQNVKIMQHKTDSVRAVMNGAIYSAVAIADATPNLNPTRQVQRVAPAQKSQFSAETNKAILGSLVQNLEMAKVSLLKETPLLEIVDKPVLPLKRSKPNVVLFTIGFTFVLTLLFSTFLLIRRFFLNVMKN